MSAILQQRVFDAISSDPRVVGAVQGGTYTGVPAQDDPLPLIGIMVEVAEFSPQLEGATASGYEECSVIVDVWDLDLLCAQQLADIVVDVLSKAASFNTQRVGTGQDFNQFDKAYGVEVSAQIANYTDGR